MSSSNVKMKRTKFTIHKVAWKWPETVKNPEVYRDDEYVVSKTQNAALSAIDFLCKKPRGLTYTITVRRGDTYYTYYRHDMPCYGGLVKYKDSHGDTHSMNPYFPRDIKVMFPEGEIIYIGICCKKDVMKAFSKFDQFVLSKESPWVSAFGSPKSVILKDGYFILTDMNTDPTVFYSIMRQARLFQPDYRGHTYVEWDPRASILIANCTSLDVRRLAAQNPIRISGGTWAQGFGYTRPFNESIFKTYIPKKLSEFHTCTAYQGGAEVDATYFANTLKKVFKVEVPSNIYQPWDKKKYEKVLVEAWDYFKEEGRKLGNTPGEKYK